MAKRGTTVGAALLSDLLSGVGTFPGANKVLVTIKSDVFRIVGSGKLEYVGKNTYLGSMARSEEMRLPKYSIVPEEGRDGFFTYRQTAAADFY